MAVIGKNFGGDIVARAAGAEHALVGHILCKRISGLNHEAKDYTVEEDSVVEALKGEFSEVGLMLRSVGVELHPDCTHSSDDVEHRLLGQIREQVAYLSGFFRRCE